MLGMPQRFDGFWTMLATPFNRQGAVDEGALQRLIDFQVAGGVAGVLALGSTGEFYALDSNERAQVLTRVQACVDGRVRTIAGANGGSTREVIANARLAKSLGYECVLLAPPYYSLPAQEFLARHFREVADAAEIDIILYDNRWQTGVEIAIPTVVALADHPRIVGIKEVGGSLSRILELIDRVGSRLQIINGLDELALDLLFWGVRCWMSGPGNFLPQEFVAIHRLARAGQWDEARSRFWRTLPVIRQIESGKYLPRIKYGCRLAGIDVGDPRPPLFALDESEQAALRDAYAAARSESGRG